MTVRRFRGSMAAALAPILVVSCATQAQHRNASTGPSLPLPEVSAETLEKLGMPAGNPVPNSLRAWQYKPDLTEAIQSLARAIHGEPMLTKTMATQPQQHPPSASLRTGPKNSAIGSSRNPRFQPPSFLHPE